MLESIFLALILFYLISCISRWCKARHDSFRRRGSRDSEPGGPPSPDLENGDGLTAEMRERRDMAQRHERRLKVLTSIVHKKVLTKPDEDSPALPHHGTALSSKSSNDDASDDEEDTKKTESETSPKSNIFVEKLKSLRSGLRLYEDQNATLYSPKSCSICLEPYREGDDICWSRNESCSHAFHQDCILDWLMDNDECPLCRENYLECSKVHESEPGEEIQDNDL